MPATIVLTRQPADATQQGYLRSLFSSPGFSFLKEVVASRCAEQQISAMNCQLYPGNPIAVVSAETAIREAAAYNQVLDILNDLERGDAHPEEWWTAVLETRR